MGLMQRAIAVYVIWGASFLVGSFIFGMAYEKEKHGEVVCVPGIPVRGIPEEIGEQLAGRDVVVTTTGTQYRLKPGDCVYFDKHGNFIGSGACRK